MSDSRRLVVSIDDQTLTLIEDGICRRVFPVSTAIKGMGFTKDSFRTPTGLFRICEKIGDGLASGTIFKARVPVGQWQPGDCPDDDLVLTRILRLDGLESSNSNTLERFVYIHGTNREDLLGKPAGHGCVRLGNDDMIELFEMAAANDLVEIQPATRPRGALLFIFLDRVLTPLDGMVELARCRGRETLREVAEIRAALRAGRIPPADAWERCMDLIRPDRDMCADAAACIIASLVPGALEFIDAARTAGWLPVVLTDCPVALVAPVARSLGVGHFEAPQLISDGFHADPGCACPNIGSFDMARVIMDWRRALLPVRVVMTGHSAVSQEIRNTVDFFACVSPQSEPADSTGRVTSGYLSFSDKSTWSRILYLPQKDS